MTSLPLPTKLQLRDSLQIFFHSSCKFPEEQSWRIHAIPRRISASATSQNEEKPICDRWEKAEQLLLWVVKDGGAGEEKSSGGGGRGQRAMPPPNRSGRFPPLWTMAGSSLLFSSNLSPCRAPDTACHTTSLERFDQTGTLSCIHSPHSLPSPFTSTQFSSNHNTFVEHALGARLPESSSTKVVFSLCLAQPTYWAVCTGNTGSLIMKTLRHVPRMNGHENQIGFQCTCYHWERVRGLFLVDVPLR